MSSIQDLIEQSSFGTAAAKRSRASISHEEAALLLERYVPPCSAEKKVAETLGDMGTEAIYALTQFQTETEALHVLQGPDLHTCSSSLEESVSMAKGDVHTVPNGDGWANKVEGNQRASNTSRTKAESQAEGRQMAINRGAEHLVHNQDGQIAQRNTYPRSRDPRASKG